LYTDNGTTSFLQPGSVINILNNKINGFKHSFAAYDPLAGNDAYIGYGNIPAGATVNINNNSFTGDSISINNGTVSQSVNASCNWYGSAAAQNFINKLSLSTVDVIPWLTNGTDNDLATGFQPVPNSCDGYPTLITLNNSTNVTCNGAANGTINITTTNGKAPFTYTWTKDGDANFVSNNEDPTGLAPGVYHLALVDGNGSNIYITDPEADGPGTINVTITEPTVLTADATGTNNICFGNTNGTATVTAGGGTASYSYLWSNGATTQSISNLIAGVYTVTVTDGNGCTKTASYQITQPDALTANATGSNVSCFGGTNGTATVTGDGGTTGYAYLWSNGATTQSISNLIAGVYSVTVTDANGCTATSSYEVTQPNVLTANASGTNVSCNGGNNGTASVTAGGGTLPYSYSWSNGSTNASISNLTAGIYTVTVTDANGCTATAFYQVTQPSQVTASITNTSTACSNNATVNANGGTPGYTYLWSNGSTATSVSGVPIGTYTVTVTDANGCTASASTNLTVAEAFNPSATVTHVSCFGLNNGSITITNANGTAPFLFSKDGGVSYVNGTIPFTFTSLAPGNYNIAVKDVNGCTGFVTKTITQPVQLTTSFTVQKTCVGLGTGSINVTVSGGSPAYNYSWSGPNSFVSSQLNISNLVAGNYILTVTDKNNCTVITPVTVNPFPAISLTEVITNISCKGGNNGTINITVSGGTGSGFIYSWTGTLISSNEDLSNLSKGTNYKITVTDIGSGCTVTKTYTITEPATNLSISANKTNVVDCNTLGTITITGSGGTPGYEYSINGVNYFPTGLFTALAPGNYTAWVRDANGCIKTSAVLTVADFVNDAYESNNSKNQAKTINVGTGISARISAATDVANWFKFTTPAGGGSFTLTLTHPSAGFTFNMYAAGNNTPALIPVNTTATTKEYALAANTIYYISVTGGLSFTCYNLSVFSTSQPFVGQQPNMQNFNTKVPQIIPSKLEAVTFPNPHQGNFTLQINSPENGMSVIQLVDAEGRIVSSNNKMLHTGNVNTVKFNNIRQAVLFYRIILDKQTTTGKIIGAN
jgi:SprB repeat